LAKAPWDSYLLKNKQGAYVPCLNNAVLILTHRSEWHNVIAYDAFAGVVVKKKQPPWSADTAPEDEALGDWNQNDSRRAVAWITNEYNCPMHTSVVDEAVQLIADRWNSHPVRDYLNALKWDRKHRIDTFLIRVAKAEDTPYVRAVTKNFFLAAVARMFKPGEKVDTMLVLEGPQNAGKSTLFRILASDLWFLDTLFTPGSKDSYQALRRRWIIEWSELDALGRVELSRVKAFISSTTDSYRPSYGKATIDFPRQCVFVGTVNPSEGYLNDPTGSRRFWPVTVDKVDLKTVRAERDQLWAEAVSRYRKNEPWHLNDPKLLQAAALEAEERREREPWEKHFRDWLAEHDRTKKGVTTEELLTKAVGMRKDIQDRSAQTKAGKVLRAIGWTVVQRGTDDTRRYFPAEKSAKT
jgi:putative DNA primase/helicase